MIRNTLDDDDDIWFRVVGYHRTNSLLIFLGAFKLVNRDILFLHSIEWYVRRVHYKLPLVKKT